jgi:hypothetical protein
VWPAASAYSPQLRLYFLLSFLPQRTFEILGRTNPRFCKNALRREFFAAKTIDKSSDLAVVFTVVSRSWKVLVGPKNLQGGAACSLDAIAPRRGGGSSGTLPNKSGPSTPSMLGPMEVSLVIWEHHRIQSA